MVPLCEGDENGGMHLSDLRNLIENRVPEDRAVLENSHSNLENVASYCEQNYLQSPDKNKAFEETKAFAIQSLASVAYQINTLARDLIDMLDLQTDKIHLMGKDIDSLGMMVNLHKEKMARRQIGNLTTNKNSKKEPKIIHPAVQEPIERYKRHPIDFCVLDEVGHGAKPLEQPMGRPNMVSRAGSSISGNHNPYGGSATYAQFERTANINNTLSRTSMRSGLTGPLGGSEYRMPQVSQVSVPPGMPRFDDSRLSGAHSEDSGERYRGAITSTPNSHQYGGSGDGTEYGSSIGLDRYGTLRAPRGGAVSPGMPLPPPPLTGQYGTLSRAHGHELPPPPASLLSSMHEDDLPPPPMQQSYFDTTQADWVPTNYLEKAVVIYDYDACKPDELSLRENAVVYVIRKNDDGWYEGVMDGMTGLFPGNYVQRSD